MSDSGDMRQDIKLPEGEVGAEITKKQNNDEQFMVTILKAMGEEAAIAVKNMANK